MIKLWLYPIQIPKADQGTLKNGPTTVKLHMYEQSHETLSPMLQQLSQSSSSPELK